MSFEIVSIMDNRRYGPGPRSNIRSRCGNRRRGLLRRRWSVQRSAGVRFQCRLRLSRSWTIVGMDLVQGRISDLGAGIGVEGCFVAGGLFNGRLGFGFNVV